MLTRTLNGDILMVREDLLSFTDTRTTFWYCDLSNWTRSVLGRKDEAPSQPMDVNGIDWALKHYLPAAIRNHLETRSFAELGPAVRNILWSPQYLSASPELAQIRQEMDAQIKVPAPPEAQECLPEPDLAALYEPLSSAFEAAGGSWHDLPEPALHALLQKWEELRTPALVAELQPQPARSVLSR